MNNEVLLESHKLKKDADGVQAWLILRGIDCRVDETSAGNFNVMVDEGDLENAKKLIGNERSVQNAGKWIPAYIIVFFAFIWITQGIYTIKNQYYSSFRSGTFYGHEAVIKGKGDLVLGLGMLLFVLVTRFIFKKPEILNYFVVIGIILFVVSMLFIK